MKKFIPYIIIGVLTIGISIETTILIMQSGKLNDLEAANTKLTQEVNNKKEKETEESQKAEKDLSIKIIISTYKEFSKLKDLNKADTNYSTRVLDTKKNLEVIFNSYTGNDTDIKDMIEAVKKHIDKVLSEISKDNKETFYDWKEGLTLYNAADNALKKCISKYALFDKVGLK